MIFQKNLFLLGITLLSCMIIGFVQIPKQKNIETISQAKIDSNNMSLYEDISNDDDLPKISTEFDIGRVSSISKISENEGYILYLVEGGMNSDLYWIGDLWIMDENGNDKHRIYTDVTGAADWSSDGKRIAVGCQEEVGEYAICILNASEILESCFEKGEDAVCQANLIEKIPIPEECDHGTVRGASWFNDGERLFVQIGGKFFILYLEDEIHWQRIIELISGVGDVSLSTDEIIIDGLWELNPNGSFKEYLSGSVPEWSQDGNKIAFVFHNYPELDSQNENEGIMQMEIKGDAVEYTVLYYSWPGASNLNQPYDLNLKTGSMRKLSWSSDGRFLAISALNGEDNNTSIFCLDTLTGKINLLAGDIEGPGRKKDYLAPAWSP